MDRLAQDVRFAFRQIVKQRGFAAVVVVTLGLAVGVNSLIVSFVNFFVLRPLPFGDVSRVVMISATHPSAAATGWGSRTEISRNGGRRAATSKRWGGSPG